MKTVILHISIAILLAAVIILSIYTINYKSKCDRIHLEDLSNMVKLWGTEDVVPDEETAKAIADIIVSKRGFFKDGMSYGNNIKLDVKNCEWIIYYFPLPENTWAGGDFEIRMRKDCGMVTSLGAYK